MELAQFIKYLKEKEKELSQELREIPQHEMMILGELTSTRLHIAMLEELQERGVDYD